MKPRSYVTENVPGTRTERSPLRVKVNEHPLILHEMSPFSASEKFRGFLSVNFLIVEIGEDLAKKLAMGRERTENNLTIIVGTEFEILQDISLDRIGEKWAGLHEKSHLIDRSFRTASKNLGGGLGVKILREVPSPKNIEEVHRGRE